MTAEFDSIAPPHRLDTGADLEAVTRWIVADAPADYEELMASGPRLPAWVRLPLLLVAALGAWAFFIWVAVRLLAH
jgi:hypothetical protein